MNYKMHLGIVVIGRNEGERLNKCLDSVMIQDISVVYVDSDSYDGSADYAHSLGVDVVRLSPDKAMSAARARNAGFKRITQINSELKYIHFIDADCELDPHWLNEAAASLSKNENIVSVCGRLREKDVKSSVFTRLCDMSWYIAPGEIASCGGIATMKVSLFEELGGFDPNLIAGEEAEFYSRAKEAGYKVYCLDVEMGTHDSAMLSFSQWWIRTVRTGFVYASEAKKGGGKLNGIIFWASILPVIIVLCSFKGPLGALVAFLYPLQILRIALKLDIPYSFQSKLLEATFCVVGKFPQFLGVMKYHINRVIRKKVNIIEYKA